MPLSAGTKLGPYEIVAPIGAGGMGEVYKARDTRLGRDVAMKVLPAELARDAERVARFEREARALASLEHPNILAIYDVGGQAGTVYVVTELLRGESLDRRLDSGPLRLAEAVDVASQAAAGLAAAHDKGIVHRDLKPANLFVLQDGRVKVLDFGLALMLPPPQEPGRDREATTRDVLTASHVIMGTMGYLSPEQVRFHRGDARSDVFAFGCVFYEMVTGRTPFQGETPTDALVAVLTQEPRPPSSLQPGIPRALEGIILRCLEKEPGKRFASARELSAELERIRIPDGTKTRRRPARMRTLAWILIAIAAAALAAALYLLPSPWRTDQGSASRAPEPQPAVPMPPTAPRWKDSVAVLPFTNLSAAPEQEYFCDGMTEQVIADLTRVPDLKVIARTSVMTYKHTEPRTDRTCGRGSTTGELRTFSPCRTRWLKPFRRPSGSPRAADRSSRLRRPGPRTSRPTNGI
jgi:serine/threonine protein kinase